MCSPRKWSQKILLIAQVEVDNVFELMHMKITTFILATSSSLFSETRWCPLEHEFRTQYSARLNSNGPSPLNGQIQMSAVWGKLVVKFPGEGTAEVFKGHTFAPPTSASLSKHWYLHIGSFCLQRKFPVLVNIFSLDLVTVAKAWIWLMLQNLWTDVMNTN